MLSKPPSLPPQRRESLLQQLKRCAGTRDLAQGRIIHSRIASLGLERDRYFANLLLQMYGKCRSVGDARELFENLHSRNRFSWSIMIGIYAQNQQLDNAKNTFDAMPDGIRDVVPWNTILTGYAQSDLLGGDAARVLFERMPQWSVVSWTAMITAYAKTGDLESLRRVFDSMPERNVVSWTAILAAYSQHGHLQQADGIFSRMPLRDLVAYNSLLAGYSQDGNIGTVLDLLDSMYERDAFTWNSVLVAYARAGQLDKAMEIFLKVPDVMSWTAMITAHAQSLDIDGAKWFFDKIPWRSTVSWNAMLAAFTEAGKKLKALDLFSEMPVRGIVSWNTLLTGFAVDGSLNSSRDIFEKMPEYNIVSWNALFTAIARNGDFNETKNCFDSLPETNLVSWNILLGAVAENGHGALDLLSAMILDGSVPDALTFTSVLGACSHVGTTSNARDHFASMAFDYGIEAERDHYGCIVDLLCRAGKLDEAEELVNSMPFLPDATEWGILLGACKIYSDLNRIDRLANILLESRPDRHGSYVLVSTTIRSACALALRSRPKFVNSKLIKILDS